MRSFTCEICQDTYPDALVNEHHKVPKSLGGSDTPDNLVLLCSGCHQSLHSVAFMIANPKRRHEIDPALCALFPGDMQKRKKLLEFASLVAKEMVLRKEIKKSPTEEIQVILELPGLYMELIRLAGYDMPGKTGRAAGVSRMIRFWVADQLGRKFPLRKAEIEGMRKPRK